LSTLYIARNRQVASCRERPYIHTCRTIVYPRATQLCLGAKG